MKSQLKASFAAALIFAALTPPCGWAVHESGTDAHELAASMPRSVRVLEACPYAPAGSQAHEVARCHTHLALPTVAPRTAVAAASAIRLDAAAALDLQLFFSDYLARSSEKLGDLPAHQFRLESLYLIPSNEALGLPARAYATFTQLLDGLEIAGSSVTCTAILKGDEVIATSIAANVYPGVTRPEGSPVRPRDAQAMAARALGIPQGALSFQREEVRHLDGVWRRVATLASDAHEAGVVATDSAGNVWAWPGAIHTHIAGRSQGRGVRFDPAATGANLNLFNLAHQQITRADGVVTFTDANGDYNTGNAAGPVEVLATLAGRWADVDFEQGGVIRDTIFRQTVEPGGVLNFLFNPAGNPDRPTAEVNAYVHTTAAHDYLAARGLTFATGANPGLNQTLRSVVNRPGHCNADFTFADPNNLHMNFFSAGAVAGITCRDTAFDTVIYHEYGHFVDHVAGRIGATREALGTSEGWGDILATYLTGQPIIGEGFFSSGVEPNFIRTADNAYRLNPLDEVHVMGHAWAGFAWHLRENLRRDLGDATGTALAEALVLPVFAANPQTIPDAVRQVALADDDDGDLLNGTRHASQIRDAAERHGLEQALPRPVITGMDPASGVEGTVVTMTGDNFPTGAGQLSVLFNGRPAAVTPVSSTLAKASVPEGARSGPITVSNPWGSVNSTRFEIRFAISGFSPTEAFVGDTLTLFGGGFKQGPNVTQVRIGMKLCTDLVLLSNTRMTVKIPRLARTGRLTAVKTGARATSAAAMTIIGRPTIRSFTPASGGPGTEVTIRGRNFIRVDWVKGKAIGIEVTLENVEEISATELRAKIPAGARRARVKLAVKNPAGEGRSLTRFTIP